MTERVSVKMTTFGLIRGRLFRISIAALLRASASALKLAKYFPVAMVICAISSLYATSPISGDFCCRTICVGVGPLVFWRRDVDIFQHQ